MEHSFHFLSARGWNRTSKGNSSMDDPSAMTAPTGAFPSDTATAFSRVPSSTQSTFSKFSYTSSVQDMSMAEKAEMISKATSHAIVSARSILMSGGTHEAAVSTAKAAAQSVLLPKSSRGKARSSKGLIYRRKMRNQAEVIASMAVVTVQNDLNGLEQSGDDPTTAFVYSPNRSQMGGAFPETVATFHHNKSPTQTTQLPPRSPLLPPMSPKVMQIAKLERKQELDSVFSPKESNTDEKAEEQSLVSKIFWKTSPKAQSASNSSPANKIPEEMPLSRSGRTADEETLYVLSESATSGQTESFGSSSTDSSSSYTDHTGTTGSGTTNGLGESHTVATDDEDVSSHEEDSSSDDESAAEDSTLPGDDDDESTVYTQEDASHGSESSESVLHKLNLTSMSSEAPPPPKLEETLVTTKETEKAYIIDTLAAFTDVLSCAGTPHPASPGQTNALGSSLYCDDSAFFVDCRDDHEEDTREQQEKSRVLEDLQITGVSAKPSGNMEQLVLRALSTKSISVRHTPTSFPSRPTTPKRKESPRLLNISMTRTRSHSDVIRPVARGNAESPPKAKPWKGFHISPRRRGDSLNKKQPLVEKKDSSSSTSHLTLKSSTGSSQKSKGRGWFRRKSTSMKVHKEEAE